MPNYLFHLHDCGKLIPDEEGREFTTLDKAVEQARLDARELLAAEVKEGKLCLGCHIEVVEQGTGVTIIVPFSASVQLESAIVDKADMTLPAGTSTNSA